MTAQIIPVDFHKPKVACNYPIRIWQLWCLSCWYKWSETLIRASFPSPWCPLCFQRSVKVMNDPEPPEVA